MSTVRIRLFSVLKERLGASEITAPVSDHATVADVLQSVVEAYPAVAAFRAVMRVAVNAEYASAETAVNPGDELAIITPVSGG